MEPLLLHDEFLLPAYPHVQGHRLHLLHRVLRLKGLEGFRLVSMGSLSEEIEGLSQILFL
jgi:hypothetical protein